MSNNPKKILKKGYDRLKKAIEKLLKPKESMPQLVLQPVRNKYLRGTDLR